MKRPRGGAEPKGEKVTSQAKRADRANSAGHAQVGRPGGVPRVRKDIGRDQCRSQSGQKPLLEVMVKSPADWAAEQQSAQGLTTGQTIHCGH